VQAQVQEVEATITQVQSQIEEITICAQSQINGSIAEIEVQVEQAINENLTLNETIINEIVIHINVEINEAAAQMEQAINDNPLSCEETIQTILARLKAAITNLLAILRGTVTQQTSDHDCIAALIEHDIKKAIIAIATRLNLAQIKNCEFKGSWPNEADCTGSMVAGLVGAYEVTGDITFKTSAELGGNYIIDTANGNSCGDEAFALSRLSQISNSPLDNPWREVLSNFYQIIKINVDGTQGYISQFAAVQPSTAMFHLANHVVAAYYVNAEDKDIWRQSLITYLARIDDSSSDHPVMALGIATWALANTGPLDNTLIDPNGQGTFYWREKKLADLPSLLLSHQVCDGEPYTGCFYRWLDYGNGETENPINGYTEDTIFATLGLISASRVNPQLHLDSAVLAACKALLEGINDEGKVFESLWIHDYDCYTFGGEMLQVLAEYAFNDCLPATIETGG
jgi:hypothetical protein